MPLYRTLRIGLVVLSFLAAAGCSRGFRVNRFPTNEALYRAGLAEFQKEKWDNAVLAFEKLTFDLPARDTLLPMAQWYLAKAHAGRGEHLLAAQAYNRMAESFATDSLADDALFEAAREYQKMWRRPTLDAQYGELALSTYQSLLGLYPDTDRKADAEKAIATLQEWFAAKDYESGMYYFRRRAYDSAIIYFKDVVENFPQTDKAREAYLRLATAYDEIRYREDKKEVCATLYAKYPRDKEVPELCGPPPAVPAAAATVDTTAKRDSL
jgi:outer membrane protein assembly factor BamD